MGEPSRIVQRRWVTGRCGREDTTRCRGGDTGSVVMHPNQLTVKIGTVRALVAEQFPAWAKLPIRAVASQGTVNALFRIGDRLAARFPLQPGDVAEMHRRLESEAEAARELARRTRFP